MKIILTVGHSILKTGSCTSADGRSFGGVLEYAYNKNIVYQAAAYLQSAGHQADILICPELKFGKSTDEREYKLSRVNSGGFDSVSFTHLPAPEKGRKIVSPLLFLKKKKASRNSVSTQACQIYFNKWSVDVMWL